MGLQCTQLPGARDASDGVPKPTVPDDLILRVHVALEPLVLPALHSFRKKRAKVRRADLEEVIDNPDVIHEDMRRKHTPPNAPQ